MVGGGGGSLLTYFLYLRIIILNELEKKSSAGVCITMKPGGLSCTLLEILSVDRYIGVGTGSRSSASEI